MVQEGIVSMAIAQSKKITWYISSSSIFISFLILSNNVLSQEYFYIEHRATNAKLHSCSHSNGDAILAVDVESDSQCNHWERVSSGDYFHIKNRHSQKHIRPDSYENGAFIVLQPNTWRGNWTQWGFRPTEGNFGYLKNRATGKHIFLRHNNVGNQVEQQPSSWRGHYTQWQFTIAEEHAPYKLTKQAIILSSDRVCGEGTSSDTFSEVSRVIGMNYEHSTEDFMFNQSGGVAAGDFDNDGWVDLYAVGGSFAPSVLLKNQGDGTFIDVAPELGIDFVERNSGPAFGDVNGDGFLDLFIGAVGGGNSIIRKAENRLLINVQGDSFYDDALNARVGVNGNTVSATWADYDYDGDLDLFMAHWIRGEFWREGKHLWQNNSGVFSDVTPIAGLNIRAVFSPNSDSSFAGTFTDLNGDNLMDLLVASDSLGSQSYENNGDGTFTDTTKGLGNTSQFTDKSGMGTAVGDYDNDGDMDWFITAIDKVKGQDDSNHGNRLYENDGSGLFTDVTDRARVRQGYWGWGACFGDFNNDGYLDIFHVNGMYPMEDDSVYDWDRFDDDPARLFINNGDKSFTEMSAEFGVVTTKQGRGVSCLDYDRDGDLDIMVANNGQSPDFFCNHGNKNNSINIRLKQPGRNVFAIGAKVIVKTESVEQIREIRTGNNYLSQNPSEAHFGLGQSTLIESVKIIWPDGMVSDIQGAQVNNQYIVERTEN